MSPEYLHCLHARGRKVHRKTYPMYKPSNVSYPPMTHMNATVMMGELAPLSAVSERASLGLSAVDCCALAIGLAASLYLLQMIYIWIIDIHIHYILIMLQNVAIIYPYDIFSNKNR